MRDTPKIPDGYVCSITQEIMIDPVIAADGHTYERSAIETWLASHATSPNTGLALPNRNLLPNIALKKAIREFVGEGTTPNLATQGLFTLLTAQQISNNSEERDKPEKPFSCAIL